MIPIPVQIPPKYPQGTGIEILRNRNRATSRSKWVRKFDLSPALTWVDFGLTQLNWQPNLLLRNHYDKAGARNLARLLKKNDPGHAKAVEKFIVEDIEALSDFYIHKTCQHYPVSWSLDKYRVVHLLWDLGWVDMDVGCYTVCQILLGRVHATYRF